MGSPGATATPPETSLAGYVGRFAPSPTGPLHFGSLLAALGSYLDARHRDGLWRLRIEDLDTYRNMAGAEDLILRSLETHGLHWDGEVTRQSRRLEHYGEALDQLSARGLTFYCTCSRKDLQGFDAYPGFCRERRTPPAADHAIRVRVPDTVVRFDDLIQGPYAQHLRADVGDFVIRRRDGIVAYQLSVVVDDIRQGITHVVRGADLLDNTPRQLMLFDYLEGARPSYAHLPVIVERRGHKLSKQTAALQVDDTYASANLMAALDLLGQAPPAGLVSESVETILCWALANYQVAAIPRGFAFDHFVGI